MCRSPNSSANHGLADGTRSVPATFVGHVSFGIPELFRNPFGTRRDRAASSVGPCVPFVREHRVKIGLRSPFDPAVWLMNRLSYPQKFAVAGTLFALPLLVVTVLYISTLNEKVELSQKAEAGSRALRLIVPIWRSLGDHRRIVLHDSRNEVSKLQVAVELFQDNLNRHLQRVIEADERTLAVLAASARWDVFHAKLRALKDVSAEHDKVLESPAVLTELIADLLTVFRQIAEVSRITADPRLDSLNLAMAATRLLPGLIEVEERLDELFDARGHSSATLPSFQIDATELLFNLRLLLEQIREGLFVTVQSEPAIAMRLQHSLTKCRGSLLSAERAMRSVMRGDESAPAIEEVERLNHTAVAETFVLMSECMNSFDDVVGARADAAARQRNFLVYITLFPAALAVYLGIGFCLAVIRTVDRMRDVTDQVLANDWRGHDVTPIEAQDELGRMIGDFGRLTGRLREEWAAANAETARATAAEESLRISEERFKLALCGTNDGIWDWDLKTDHVFYSTRFKELLGYGNEEFGVWLSAMADVLHPEDFEATWEAMERHLKDRVAYHIEHRLRTKSGEYRWYLERGQAVWDEHGVPIRMAGSVSDVTATRQAIEALRASEDQLQAILDNTPAVIYVKDLEGRYRLTNGQFARVFHQSQQSAVGKMDFDLFTDEIADRFHRRDQRVLQNNRQEQSEEVVPHAGGVHTYLAVRFPMRDANGTPYAVCGISTDITERKLAENRERIRKYVLELLTSGEPLPGILNALASGFDEEFPFRMCSILLLDKSERRLFTAAAPKLPHFYCEAINGVEIGLGVGSCGTVAFTGERVIVEDIQTHPYWASYKELAARAGLVACWSEPICGESGKVLGTFAVYAAEAGLPTESEIRLIETAAKLAGIAIERKQVEEALRTSEERWKFALEGAGDGVRDWNIQTGEVVFSKRFLEIVGLPENAGAHTIDEWKCHIHPDDLPRVVSDLQAYFDGQTATYSNEHRIQCRDGVEKWILDRGMIVSHTATGEPLRMIGTYADITQRKRAEEENRQYLAQVEQSRDRITQQTTRLIRQSEELAKAKDEAEAAARVKSQFLANMSHELRTPLTAILGYADLLSDEGDLARAQLSGLETLEIIRSNGRHLQELIDDILNLSKLDAGYMTLEKLQVSPLDVARDVLRLMNLRAGEKGLTLRCEVIYPIPDQIATDLLRVRQVLVNLVGNAIKFTELGRVTLTLRYDLEAKQLRFSVADTGIGIHPDQMERLFTPFSQADASMSRRYGGTGLGLSISQRLARLLGGDIQVESQAGIGSEFTFLIPVELDPNSRLLTEPEPIEQAVAVPAVVVIPPPSTSKLSGRILLAEDVPANQKLISFLLQKNGASVEVVDNGRFAVEHALAAQRTSREYDLILMDISMPEMDGYTATAALREAGYQGRIIALTAHATEEDRQRCLDSGFDGFATKPIQKDQLIAACLEHMGQSRSARSLVPQS